MKISEEFRSFQVFHHPELKGLEIVFNAEHSKNFLSPAPLAEIKLLVLQCHKVLDLQSLTFRAQNGQFGGGLEPEWMLQVSGPELKEHLQNMLHTSLALLHLPQTILVDLGTSAHTWTLEFFCNADLRIAQNNLQAHLNFLSQGLIPSCGGIGVLAPLVSSQKLRNWLLSGQDISCADLLSTGLLLQTYENEQEREEIRHHLLQRIARQAPMSRMQAKMALLEMTKEQLSMLSRRETQFANLCMTLNDWREALLAQREERLPSFLCPSTLAKNLQKVPENSTPH
jgi:enoyl-CoA hydratase/carnithine racemase